MVHCISTHSSSSVDIQSKHLCNYWLRFPPSLLWPLHHFLTLFLHLAADSYLLPVSAPSSHLSSIPRLLSCWITPIKYDSFAVLSRSFAWNCWRAAECSSPPALLHLSFHPNQNNIWNCRQQSKAHPGSITTQGKSLNHGPPWASLMKPTVLEFNPGLRSVKQKCDTGKAQEAMKPDRHLL